MRIQSELCHIENNRVVVKVKAWQGELDLGSTLAEGPTVIIAEENGIKQLLKRIRLKEKMFEHYLGDVENTNKDKLHGKKLNSPIPTLSSEDKIESKTTNKVNQEKNNAEQPEDWSKELISIDNLIKTLGWNRVEENNFLNEKYGIADRNRITTYKMITSYLEQLTKLIDERSIVDKSNSDEIKLALDESNRILQKLGWDTKKARNFLQTHMNVASRQQLDFVGLKKFNNMLNGQLTSIDTSSSTLSSE